MGADGAGMARVFVSALRGTGLDLLRQMIARAAADGGLKPPGQAPDRDQGESAPLPDSGPADAYAALPSLTK